jgi:transposase
LCYSVNEYKHKTENISTIPNKNICVPIGSILAVQSFYEKLDLCEIFSKNKSKGLGLNNLLIGWVAIRSPIVLVSRKLAKWLNQEEILNILNLKRFMKESFTELFKFWA